MDEQTELANLLAITQKLLTGVETLTDQDGTPAQADTIREAMSVLFNRAGVIGLDVELALLETALYGMTEVFGAYLRSDEPQAQPSEAAPPAWSPVAMKAHATRPRPELPVEDRRQRGMYVASDGYVHAPRLDI